VTEAPDRAAWLAGDVLLLCGGDAGAGALQATVGDEPIEVASHTFVLTPNGDESGGRALVVGRFDAAGAGTSGPLTLTVGTGGPIDADQLAGRLMEPFAMIRQELAPLDPEARSEALRFLWSASAPVLERPGSFPLAQLLARVRRELHPPLPRMTPTRDHPAAAYVDSIARLGPRELWVRGWLLDTEGAVTRLTLFAPEGARAELTSGLFRYRRKDTEGIYGTIRSAEADPHGLLGYVELDGTSHLSTGWSLELETKHGDRMQSPVPELLVDPVAARDTVLLSMHEEPPGSDELMRRHGHPALTVIQDGVRDSAHIETVAQLGDPPASPSVSVIVPLFGVLTFLEDQMAQWASDPQIAQEDLIYVLDSPEQAAALDELARGLFSLYRIPFRIAVMRNNVGFACVNNRAVELARADKLLLLNSDVVPDTPGWLGRMSAFYEATPAIGALGPKLLYEDESIQHAGMYFYRAPGSRCWENMHFFKGQHRHLPAANVARKVPAVTGACMMVRREHYENAGGLSHAYVQGGYEDSDFCLRLIEAGLENWYMPGAELYHLEDQSYPEDLRARATRYNAWLHTQVWDKQMETVMQD
jgi:GT2 family glycosyltransferase